MITTTLDIAWSLDVVQFNASSGLWTHVVDEQASQGWHSSPGVRTDRQPRLQDHGSWRGPNYRSGKVVVLKGWTEAVDRTALAAARRELAALCSDPTTLYQLRRVDARDGTDYYMEVELDDAVEIVHKTSRVADGGYLEWEIQVASIDGVKYHTASPDPLQVPPPVPPTGGLNFTGGMDYTGGLDFGVSGSNSIFTLTNPGTAPMYPVFEVFGPANGFEIRRLDTGKRLQQSREVLAGETAILDLRDKTSYINGQNYRGTMGEASWAQFVLQGGQSLTAFFLPYSYDVLTTKLVVSVRISDY